MTARTPAAALAAAETAAAALAPYTAPMAPNTSRLVHLTGPRIMADRAAYGVTADYADETGTVHRTVFGIACPADLAPLNVLMTSDATPGGVRVTDPERFGPLVDAAWIAALVNR